MVCKGKPQRWAVSVSGNLRITFGWLGDEALDIDLDIDFEGYH